jgi:hypothetical protein
MRKLLAAVILVGALPLTAGAETCLTADVERHSNGGPKLGELIVERGPVRIEIVGSFFWLQVDDGEILSVEVPVDAIGVTACESGDVTFTFPETNDVPEPAVIVNVVDYWRPWYGVHPV